MEETKYILEYNKIIEMLCQRATSEQARERLRTLTPTLNEDKCRQRLEETTHGKEVLEALGSPPLAMMKDLEEIILLCDMGSVLTPEQLTSVGDFVTASKRMIKYLKKAADMMLGLGNYAGAFSPLDGLGEDIARCIRGNAVDDNASPGLRRIRGRIEAAQMKVRERLESMLRNHPEWYADGYVSMRSGHYVLPVRKGCKGQVQGSTIDMSASRNTLFIEPHTVGKLREELDLLQSEEANEVYRILCELTEAVALVMDQIRWNMDAMRTLDIIFAKAKLSLDMDARPVDVGCGGLFIICQGRHPLLDKDKCVPLDYKMDNAVNGIVITGPNTGGKTVALKTVGLLSMMVQAGLHVPVQPGSRFRMYDAVLCDIGDGQSISENLSTFSAHLTNIISILDEATNESLVLLDELGSGTDPAEGMGIAISILHALREIGCKFAATTHYPEVKDYAAAAGGLVNARMAFDKEHLAPLYRLEIGEAGESCALYIARRLGFPEALLDVAQKAAYKLDLGEINAKVQIRTGKTGRLQATLVEEEPAESKVFDYQVGDSVRLLPSNELGIVYRPADDTGHVWVQVKGEKKKISHKRLKLHVGASQLYPEDYDFSIIFDTVENRKARHQMGKRHQEGMTIEYEPDLE